MVYLASSRAPGPSPTRPDSPTMTKKPEPAFDPADGLEEDPRPRNKRNKKKPFALQRKAAGPPYAGAPDWLWEMFKKWCLARHYPTRTAVERAMADALRKDPDGQWEFRIVGPDGPEEPRRGGAGELGVV